MKERTFIVNVQKISIRPYEVKAKTKQEAMEIARKGNGKLLKETFKTVTVWTIS